MTDMAIEDRDRLLRVLPAMGPSAAEVRTMRAVCEDCGAHAAVVTAGASMTGSCSVCGGGTLHLMDERLPPPTCFHRT